MVMFLCLTFDSSINEREQVAITCALLCETTKQCGRSLKDQRCFNIGTNSAKTVKRIKKKLCGNSKCYMLHQNVELTPVNVKNKP